MSEPYISRIDRRTALTWLGAAAAAIAAGGADAAGPVASARGVQGYGTDPNLLHPTISWPRMLTAAQLQTAALLCDFILPASADAPSANALGVPDFIDEWISAPYPSQVADRPVIIGGLDWLRAQPASGRDALLQQLAGTTAGSSMAEPRHFFRKFRILTIGAYYTTKPGFKDVGYIGNVPLKAYPGPSDAVKAVLDARLKTLGL
jgi:hypothetical protein